MLHVRQVCRILIYVFNFTEKFVSLLIKDNPSMNEFYRRVRRYHTYSNVTSSLLLRRFQNLTGRDRN